MSILRITVIRLHETPKFLLTQGKDAEVAEFMQGYAREHNRPCSLTLEKLEACGPLTAGVSHGKTRFSFGEFRAHIRGLFSTKKLALSTSLIWLSWTLIGLAYPLFYVFLPQYLASRGAETGEPGAYYTWRNYMITNVCGIFGPIAAGYMCNLKWLGRRYTMVIGALISCAFFFA